MNLTYIADVPDEPRQAKLEYENIRVPTQKSASGLKCYYSGAESKQMDPSNRWVNVPPALLSDPYFSPKGPFELPPSSLVPPSSSLMKAELDEKGPIAMDTEMVEGDGGDEKRTDRLRLAGSGRVKRVLNGVVESQNVPVALEFAVNKIAAAREVAHTLKCRQEVG